MKKHILPKVALGALLIAPIALAYYSGVTDHFSLASLKANKVMLHTFVSEQYALSVLYYIGIYILVAACSFPFISLVTIAGGFLFGTLLSALYTNIGATIGGMIAFLAYRYLFGEWVRAHYSQRLATFNQEIKTNGAWYLVTIRFIPLIPFFVANALASVAPISLTTFLWTTSVGIIPSSLLYSFAGEQLDAINTWRDIFSGKVIIAFALLALLIVASWYLHQFRTKQKMTT